mgnify:CR=1 FL=1|tara:strand:+ start:44 stop:532 length:489 start_codon:yes stop_codon:yes gene_type:complete
MKSLDELILIGMAGARMNCTHDELVPVLLMARGEDTQAVALDLRGAPRNDRKLYKSYRDTMIKDLLRKFDPTHYVHVAEAWSSTSFDAVLSVEGDIEKLPPEDRFEVAALIAVEKNNPEATGYIAKIETINEESGHRELGEWERCNTDDPDFPDGGRVISRW